jgi:hypothetical protein
MHIQQHENTAYLLTVEGNKNTKFAVYYMDYTPFPFTL